MTNTNEHVTLNFTLATAGHVDHGKTSLLRALTGIDPDRLKEEKEREMTTDIGFAHSRFSLGDLDLLGEGLLHSFKNLLKSNSNRLGRKNGQAAEIADADEVSGDLVIGFVDVPGHGKFLKNMLAGVGGIDMALLVVAADEGPMPQTVQHVKILSLLGVRSCILTLTKTDLASPSELDQCLIRARELVERFSIKVLDAVPVNNVNQDGIENLRLSIVRQLLEHEIADRRRDLEGEPMPPFLPIDRVFSKSGYGVVVTGTLVEGELKVSDHVSIEPGGITARVRGLETFGRRLERAFPGQRLAVNLSLRENRTIERGQVIVSSSKPVSISTLIIEFTDLGGLETNLDRKRARLKPQPVRFYQGTAERVADLVWTRRLSDNDTKMIAQVRLSEPVVAYPDQQCVIRYGDYGVAGGRILMTARPRWLTGDRLLAIARARLDGNTGEALLLYLKACPTKAMSVDDLKSVISPFRLNLAISELVEKGALWRAGQALVAQEESELIARSIVEAVSRSALVPVPQEKLRVELAPLVERSVFQHILTRLFEKGLLDKREQGLVLPGAAKGKAVSESVRQCSKRVNEILKDHICIEIAELASRISVSANLVTEAVEYLDSIDAARLVNYEYVSSCQALDTAHHVLARIFQQKRIISPSDFRQQSETSRKYAMAMLAYFDDQKITRRLPTGRVLVKAPPGGS